MSQSIDDIRRLLPVLEMAFQAQQLRMAKINKRVDTLKAQLREIDRPTSHQADPMNPAVRAGADMRWQSWAQDRKILINQEMAIAMRDREAVRVDMRSALSKLEAARRVEHRIAIDHQKDISRRSSW